MLLWTLTLKRAVVCTDVDAYISVTTLTYDYLIASTINMQTKKTHKSAAHLFSQVAEWKKLKLPHLTSYHQSLSEAGPPHGGGKVYYFPGTRQFGRSCDSSLLIISMILEVSGCCLGPVQRQGVYFEHRPTVLPATKFYKTTQKHTFLVLLSSFCSWVSDSPSHSKTTRLHQSPHAIYIL